MEALNDKACVLAEAGQYQAAADVFQQALQLNAGSAILHSKVHDQLAQCYSELTQWDVAYHYALQAVQLHHQWSAGWITLARCALNCGHIGQAVECYSYAQALEPSSIAEQELQGAQQLLQQQVARRIGLPALQIHICAEHGVGPGGRLWECGVVLAQHIVQHPETVAGKAVLELGAGASGVVGITAAAMGAASTLLTDTSAIMHLTEAAIEANKELLSGCQCQAIPLEWHCDRLPQMQQLDVILAADLIYAERNIAPLTNTLRQLRKHSPEAVVLLAHKCRQEALDQALFVSLAAAGIFLEELEHSAETAQAITLYSGRLTS